MECYVSVFADNATRGSIFTRQNWRVMTNSIFGVNINGRHTNVLEYTIDTTIIRDKQQYKGIALFYIMW